jgi:hypothetical protein
LSQVLLETANDPNKSAKLILPEGASTSGDYMLCFHLGAFISDLPVQVVTIRIKIWDTTRSLHHTSSGCVKLVWSSRASGSMSRADQQRRTDWVWRLAATSSFPRRFFPLLAAVLRAAQLGRGAFEQARITLVIIRRHVRILCSSYFFFCKSLLSTLFEWDSELIHICNYFKDFDLDYLGQFILCH